MIVALITGVTSIITAKIAKDTNKKMNDWNEMKDELKKEILQEVSSVVKKEISELKMDDFKTYLTDFISDVNNGEHKTEHQKARASELYDYYTKNGGNSYIHTEMDKLKKNGLI